MSIGNILLLSQVTIYVITFLFSLFIVIPLTVYEAQFNGHCLLYATATGELNSSLPVPTLSVQWGDGGYCKYPIVMGVLALPLSLFYILWMSLHLFKDYDLSWLASFVALVTSVTASFLMLVAGIILTTGFKKWCDLIRHSISSCDVGEIVQFNIGDDIDKSGYYVEFGMAQFGTWLAWICWLIQTSLASVKLWRFHRQENFFISMKRERTRLIQRMGNNNEVL